VREYYYFIAQLPSLVYGQKPPMSSAHFKSLAEDLLEDSDLKVMEYLSFNDPFSPEGSCAFVKNWRNWERALKLNLAKERAIKLKRAVPDGEIPFFPQEASITAVKAVDEKSPLDGEYLLDKARWTAIDEIAGRDYYSVNNIYAYYLKLLLLERRQGFNIEKGFADYKNLYAEILASAHHSSGETK